MSQDELLQNLTTENERLRAALSTALTRINDITFAKLKETRDELENSYNKFATNMYDIMNISTIPLAVSDLIVPLARRFPDWNINFSTHKGKGVAYIRVSRPVEKDEIGIMVWKDYSSSKEDRHVRCNVHEGFKYPGWESDTLVVPLEKLYETLEGIHSNIRELALDYISHLPPEVETKSSPDFSKIEHNGC